MSLNKVSEASYELYEMIKKRGWPEMFCEEICKNLNTEFTARRMIGYLYQNANVSLEEVVDEMLAIMSDRDRIVEKKILKHSNTVYNEFLRNNN